MLKQWFLNIRSYADEMLDDLDHLNKWPDVVKEVQRGWIGKSQGTNAIFKLKNKNDTQDSELYPLEIFTTRLDTIYGATFIAISHESPLIKSYLLKNN